MRRPKMNRTRVQLLGAWLLASLSCVGCHKKADDSGNSAEGGAKVWVGSVDGSDAVVGIVASDTNSTLFFCGGNNSYRDTTHWFANTTQPVSAGATAQDGQWSAHAEPHDADLQGTLQRESGGALSFSAHPAQSGSLEGVYDGAGPCGHLGLIVQRRPSSDELMAQGTCIKKTDNGVLVEQVNPVMNIERGADGGIAVELASAPGERFSLHPLALH